MSLLNDKRVLIVEDTTIAATYLARELTDMGANVVGLARSEAQAVEMVDGLQPELILMDIHLGEGGNGINAAKKIRSQHHIPLIYTTSFSDDGVLSAALDTSPYGYIVKPFDHKTIKVSCETALKRFELESALKGAEARFRLAAEAADAGIFELDESGSRFTYTGAASLKHRLGGGTETTVAQFLSLFNEEDKDGVLADMQSQSCLRKTIRVPKDEQGNECWLDVLFSEVSIADEHVTIGAVVDVTEKQVTSRKLRLSSIILDQLAEGVAILNASYHVTQGNRSLYRLLGFENEQPPLTLNDLGIPDSVLSSCEQIPSSVLRHKLSLRRKNNTVFPAFATVSRLDEPHSDDLYVITISDLSELQKAERKLENLAFSDALTGAGNQQYLNLLLDEAVFSQALRGVINIHVDNLSRVSEEYGHELADELLMGCATRIEQSIPESDILIRPSGSKFIVLNQGDGDAARLSTELLKALSLPYTLNGNDIDLTASIGFAIANDGQSAENLLRCAETALHEARRKGKNVALAFSEEQPAPARYNLALKSDIKTAIANDEIGTSFRPIFDREENLVGLDAQFSCYGEPIRNTPVLQRAEGREGLQNPLWITMLRELCIASRLLTTSGLQDVKLFVDSELLNIYSPAIAEQLATFVRDFHVSASQFVLGIKPQQQTEHRSKLTVRALRKHGFNFYLSDFVSDSGSLNFLLEDSAFAVKIDGDALVENGEDNYRKVVPAIANFALALDKKVLLDGINSPEFQQLASTWNIDYFQGHYYGSAKSLSEILNSSRWYDKKIS